MRDVGICRRFSATAGRMSAYLPGEEKEDDEEEEWVVVVGRTSTLDI